MAPRWHLGEYLPLWRPRSNEVFAPGAPEKWSESQADHCRHQTGDITSHYSAPELAKQIRAENAVLKAQESTLLRVVTRQSQVVNDEKSRKRRADGHQRKSGPEALN